MLKTYYHLIKPGIVRGNIITAVAGFLLASRGQFDIWLFLGTVIGLALVIASACVINNVIDRDIDSKMKRTKKRALVTNDVTVSSALAFATVIGLVGFGIMLLLTNTQATFIALVGYVAYASWYTYAKRKTPLSTIIGTISGSTPIVIGYVAVTGQLDTTALVLFAAMVYWQLAHFYAIALFRQDEYENAGLPLWPMKYGRSATVKEIAMAAGFYFLTVLILGFIAQLGTAYYVVMTLLCAWWLYRISRVSIKQPSNEWARSVFKQSLIILLVWSALISVDHWIA